MPSIEAVAKQVLLDGLPVLFLDTCVPLDILRSPMRDMLGLVPTSVRLSEVVSATPSRCDLVTPSFVPEEWEANHRNVFKEVTTHFRAIDEHATRFHDILDALRVDAGFGRPTYSGSGVAEKLLALAELLLGHAIRIDQDDASALRAVERVRLRRPPSRGGMEVRDCTIVEESLAVCRHLRDAGYQKSKVFCTSNVRDYCDSRRQLHANLATEFDEVGLTFTSNLQWAVSELYRVSKPLVGQPTPPGDPAGGEQT